MDDKRQSDTFKQDWKGESVRPEDIVRAYPTAKIRQKTNTKCWNRLNDMIYDMKWKVSVIFTIYVVTFLVILRIQTDPRTFGGMSMNVLMIKIVCYLIYLFDTAMHIIQRNEKIISITTKPHPLHPVPWIVVDVISLLPIEFVIDVLPSSAASSSLQNYAPFCALNEILRIYRIPLFVWEIENRFDLILVLIYLLSMLGLVILINHFIEFIWLQCLGRWYARGEPSWMDFITIAVSTGEPIEWYFMTYAVTLSMFNRFFQGVVQLTNNPERITCTLVWWLGLFVEYGLFFGGLLASFITFHKLRLMYEEAESYLNQFLRIRDVDPDTCVRAKTYYHMLWTDASGVKTSLLFNHLPGAMRKELLLDVFWEALKHSHLLSARPTAVKRSISMKMIHEYYMPGDMIYKEGEIVDKMVYIVDGVIDVLSSEDKRTPIMSFTNGTCLGETSLVFQPECKNSVRCATFCVVQILYTWDALAVLTDYPASQAEIVERMQRRLKHAMDVQRNAELFKPQRPDPLDENAFPPQEVKWVKDQWRKLHAEQKSFDDQMRIEGLGWERRRLHHPIKRPNTPEMASERIFQRDVYEETIARAVHTSAFLDLFVLADETPFEVKLVCVQTKFPWIYAPESDFTVLWDFVLFMSVVTYECYIVPFFLSFFISWPYWWFCWGVWCDLVAIIDLLITLHTAVKGIPETASSVAAIAMYRLQTMEFYVKAIIAVPWHWLAMWVDVDLYNAMQLRFLRMVWAIKLANMVSVRASRHGGLLYVCKYAWFLSTLVYWFACFQHLLDCFEGNCAGYNWFMDFSEYLLTEGVDLKNDLGTHFLLCMMYSASCIGRFTFVLAYPCSIGDQILYVVMLVLGFVCNTFWMAEYCSLQHLKNISKYKFSELIATIDYFEKRMKLPLQVHRDVARFLSFQFESNAGTTLIDEEAPILPLDSAPDYLMASLKESARDAVRAIPIFVGADEDMIKEMAERIVYFEYPNNMLVTRGGELTTSVFILRRGICRCISHWRPDVERKITWTLNPGDCFPLMEVLHGLPSMVSVRTESACVIAMVELHDWEAVLRRFPDEKRLLQAVTNEHGKSWNLADVPIEDPQLRLMKEQRGRLLRRRLMERHARETMRIRRKGSSTSEGSIDFEDPQTPFDEDAAEYERVWAERRIARLLRRTMYRKRSYDPSSNFVFWWEVSRVAVVVAAVFLHPCAYSAALGSFALRCVCLLFDIFGLVDIYIRLQVGHYGENGILITHPAMTATYYAKHTMAFDLLSNFPLEYLPVRHIFVAPNYIKLRFWLRLLRLLQIYRFFSFMDFLESHFSYRFRSPDLVKATVFIYAIINFTANAMLFDTCNVTPIAPENNFITHFSTPYELNCTPASLVRGISPLSELTTANALYTVHLFYFVQLYTATTDGFFQHNDIHRGSMSLMFSIFGWMARFWIVTTVTSLLAAERWLITRSRIQLDSLVQFLRAEHLDERLIEMTVTSFDYEWRHRRGLNIPRVLQRVPPLLRADVLFHRCRNALSRTRPMNDAHVFFLREISSNAVVNVFNRGRFLMRINDVQNRVFLLDKGRLEVWGPGDIPVRRLARGALFGNLKRRPRVRQSMAVVARTHVVALSWTNEVFYRILDSFPDVLAHFEEINIGELEFVDDLFQKETKQKFKVPQEVKSEGWSSSRTVFVRKFSRAKKGQEPERVSARAPKINKLLQSEKLHRFCEFLLYHFIIPMSVCCVMFDSTISERLEALLIIIYVCDVFFLVKIICGLSLPYINPDYDREKAKFHVRRNYTSDPFKFTVDVASTIPFETSYWNIRWLESNRYLRLIPLIRCYYHLFNKLHVSTASRWFRCMIMSLMVVCGLAALHITFRCDSKSHCEYLTDVKNVFRSSYKVTDDTNSVVTLSLVFAMNRMSLAAFMEPPPQYLRTIIYLLVLTIISHALYTSFAAYVACLMNSARKKRCDFYIFVQRLVILLRNLGVSSALKRRAMEYVNNVWRNEQGRIMPSLLDRAPDDLRLDLMSIMYGFLLKNDPVLGRGHSDMIYQMTLFLQRYVYFWGDVIVEKDDVDGCLYILQSGIVEAIVKDQFLTEKVHYVITEGTIFGLNSGLFEGEPHMFTYRATTKSIVLSLERTKWWHLLDFFPSAREDVIEYARTINIKY